ncbi:MAG: HYR domain-containing protein [Verrucomicrobiales bacterium]|nr:HYR domain-containing protein [Verrucomicrobiales bacterium]
MRTNPSAPPTPPPAPKHPRSEPRPSRVRWVVTLTGLLAPLALGQGLPDDGGPRVLKFECGMVVATCFSRGSLQNDGATAYCATRPSMPDGYVVGIMDLRDPVGAGATPLSNWLPAMTHNELGTPQHQWKAANLGEVFGIALDQQTPPNIYVAATSVYPGDYYPTNGGPGAVYRIDGSTYQISPLIKFNDVGSVSLGNLCYDPVHNQIFVADLDHGWIRRVSMAGVELSKFDHGATGRPAASLSAIADTSAPGQLTNPGRRVFAVQYFGNRVYYSVWDTVTSPGTGPGANTIWSIGLQPNGDFATGPGSARLEIPAAQLPWDPTPHLGVNPPTISIQVSVVTDIAFASDGRMLTAERGLCFQDQRNLTTFAHFSPAREFRPAGTNWIETTAPNGIGVGNSNPGHNSEGGIDYDCANQVYVTGDLYVQVPTYIYGVEILSTATSPFNSAYLVDLDGSTLFYDKSYLGDVEVYRCCDCLEFVEENVQCLAGSGQYTWSFCVTNTGTLTNGHLTFIDLPAGVTASPPIIDLVPPLKPGQGLCTNVTFTFAAGVSTNKLCFRIAAHTPDFADCCVVSKCLEVPECCGLVTQESVVCDPASAGLTWNLQLVNQSGVPAHYAIIVPDPANCVSVANPIISLNPPLASGQSTNLSVTLNVTNSPCDRACFRISFHDAKFVACCSFTHCVALKCDENNHPPVVDCPPPIVEVCDPNGGKNYTIAGGAMDPDGDALTILWKVNGNPVATNTIPAGVSANFTAISLVRDYPPGTYTVTACVTDGHGPPVICTVKLIIGDQTPPTIQCPPDRVIEKWEMTLGDYTGQVMVEDGCTPKGQIKITQSPPPGTLIGPGTTCIQFTATDAAGNTATCVSCITLVPVQMVSVAGGFAALPPTAPTNITLRVTGDLEQTGRVEYFANGASLGIGVPREFAFAWQQIGAGTYEISANATRAGAPDRTYRTAPVYLLVIPRGGGSSAVRLEVVFRDNKLHISIPTSEGENCFVESSDSLGAPGWKVISSTVGDGVVHVMEVDPKAGQQFIRVRVEQ